MNLHVTVRDTMYIHVIMIFNCYVLVSVNGTYPHQRMREVMLVAVPLNAVDETTMMGEFQVKLKSNRT